MQDRSITIAPASGPSGAAGSSPRSGAGDRFARHLSQARAAEEEASRDRAAMDAETAAADAARASDRDTRLEQAEAAAHAATLARRGRTEAERIRRQDEGGETGERVGAAQPVAAGVMGFAPAATPPGGGGSVDGTADGERDGSRFRLAGEGILGGGARGGGPFGPGTPGFGAGNGGMAGIEMLADMSRTGMPGGGMAQGGIYTGEVPGAGMPAGGRRAGGLQTAGDSPGGTGTAAAGFDGSGGEGGSGDPGLSVLGTAGAGAGSAGIYVSGIPGADSADADSPGAGIPGAGISGAGISGPGISGPGIPGAGIPGAGIPGAGMRQSAGALAGGADTTTGPGRRASDAFDPAASTTGATGSTDTTSLPGAEASILATAALRDGLDAPDAVGSGPGGHPAVYAASVPTPGAAAMGSGPGGQTGYRNADPGPAASIGADTDATARTRLKGSRAGDPRDAPADLAETSGTVQSAAGDPASRSDAVSSAGIANAVRPGLQDAGQTAAPGAGSASPLADVTAAQAALAAGSDRAARFRTGDDATGRERAERWWDGPASPGGEPVPPTPTAAGLMTAAAAAPDLATNAPPAQAEPPDGGQEAAALGIPGAGTGGMGTETSRPGAAGTAAEPPRTPAPRLADQIAPAVIRLDTGANGTQRLTIRLDPESLGQLEIRIERSGASGTSVRVLVERPETLALLAADQPALERALDQAGMTAARDIILELAGPEADPPSPPAPFDQPPERDDARDGRQAADTGGNLPGNTTGDAQGRNDRDDPRHPSPRDGAPGQAMTHDAHRDRAPGRDATGREITGMDALMARRPPARAHAGLNITA